ncbi:hypothetical protein NECAME_05426 [Necator americanus]|uniref:EGF-like domain-containing protein n=1 Tax=Necator americanus TaxID=51031 RepID=W2SJC6_NECAM|nr:hypothetical protein NECAME_05426 [Necator americanus]ETN68837.1 hypothetical protein NECAME_05426 [Necator americanus]
MHLTIFLTVLLVLLWTKIRQRVDIYQGANVTTRVLPGYCALPDGQCTLMNLDAIVDPRQHAFRQIIFAIENSAAMNLAAFNLVRIIDLTVSQMNATNTELQFSLVLYDDKDIRFVSSTYDGDLFVNQFSNAMVDVMSSSRTVLMSRSLDVVFKVNVFTIRDDSDELINADLVYYQRVSGGRNLPVTVDGLLRLPPLLTSSIYENSMVTDEAAQDCSTPTTFSINYDEYASKVVVNVVGADVHLPNLVVLTTSTGYRIDVKNMFLDQNTITFSVDPQQYSIFVKPWLLAVTTTSGPCFVQVRVVSSVTVIPGFTTASASDFPAESPFSLRDSSVYPRKDGDLWINASTCNHGSLDVNGFGECVCFNGHTGQFCNQPICQNGGTKSSTAMGFIYTHDLYTGINFNSSANH